MSSIKKVKTEPIETTANTSSCNKRRYRVLSTEETTEHIRQTRECYRFEPIRSSPVEDMEDDPNVEFVVPPGNDRMKPSGISMYQWFLQEPMRFIELGEDDVEIINEVPAEHVEYHDFWMNRYNERNGIQQNLRAKEWKENRARYIEKYPEKKAWIAKPIPEVPVSPTTRRFLRRREMMLKRHAAKPSAEAPSLVLPSRHELPSNSQRARSPSVEIVKVISNGNSGRKRSLKRKAVPMLSARQSKNMWETIKPKKPFGEGVLAKALKEKELAKASNECTGSN